MKQILFLLILSSFVSVNINAQRKVKVGVDYTCSFAGKDRDIAHFIGAKDSVGIKNMKLNRFADFYMFSINLDYIKTFVVDVDYFAFITDKPSFISGWYESDRRYKLKSIDLEDETLTIVLKRKWNKTYTRLKGKTLTINCKEIIE